MPIWYKIHNIYLFSVIIIILKLENVYKCKYFTSLKEIYSFKLLRSYCIQLNMLGFNEFWWNIYDSKNFSTMFERLGNKFFETHSCEIEPCVMFIGIEIISWREIITLYCYLYINFPSTSYIFLSNIKNLYCTLS